MRLDHIEDAIGRQLLHVIKQNRYILLVFDEDVKCELRATHGYGVDDTELEEGSSLDISDYSKDDLLECGVITQAWLDEQEAARKEKLAWLTRSKEAAELAEYKRLKKKYEK